MTQRIATDKFVELTYRLTDRDTGRELGGIDYALGYVHGRNDNLAPEVLKELEGRKAGDEISVEVDCTRIFGPRDEGLVFTDRIENVPEEYRKVGTRIVMENDKGEAREFIVTHMDDESLTVDGNNPLCGRTVIFTLKVLDVRDATAEEIEAGGPVVQEPQLDGLKKAPVDQS